MPLSRINSASIANSAVIAADIADGTITAAKIISVANTQITGNIVSSQITSVANTQLTGTITGSQISSNTLSNTVFQTGSVENYLNAGGRPLSNRNLIFNGAMQIAQRNTSVTTITTNDAVLTADRWKITSGSLGTWTMNVESNGPTSTGLTKSANLICTSAQSSPPASSYLLFKQDMEGQMMQSIKKGTPGAEQVTVSFWVKSSNTGTFIAEMRDNDNSRACSRSFTINSADTWEKETITFPADTTGQLDNDNARSMELAFWFGSGSDYAGGTLQTTWGTSAGADNTRAAGQLNLANRAGNYIAFTGIQWEIGPVATPFEFEDIGTTLRKCQRYCHVFRPDAVATFSNIGFATVWSGENQHVGITLPVSMRTAPTVTYSSISHIAIHMPGVVRLAVTAASVNTNQSGNYRIVLGTNTASSGDLVSHKACHCEFNGTATGFLAFSAEL
jgi:hypothetical protein